ncbi:MAG TPA: alpha-ketoglutarate-dependent dioxygenase AlkB [Planctomycetota bacterium]|nr:alpha-ketoglutarate-dependent dioxygenase AlkB [Planctomycetota bacterium]
MRLERIALDAEHEIFRGRLPGELHASLRDGFDELWALHPDDYHEIKIHGKLVKTPRWQQAYGADYHYTGRVNRGRPVPPVLDPVHAWTRRTIDERLNGVLVNWYDADHEHYIGKHRDSTIDMIEGTPIVTVSLGAARTFRLRPWKKKGQRDLLAEHGTVFVMPFATNLAWTHEVPHFASDRGRRISITFRAFALGNRGAS